MRQTGQDNGTKTVWEEKGKFGFGERTLSTLKPVEAEVDEKTGHFLKGFSGVGGEEALAERPEKLEVG
jgi:hypothetical protein